MHGGSLLRPITHWGESSDEGPARAGPFLFVRIRTALTPRASTYATEAHNFGPDFSVQSLGDRAWNMPIAQSGDPMESVIRDVSVRFPQLATPAGVCDHRRPDDRAWHRRHRPRFSASSTPCCCGRCPTTMRRGWARSGPTCATATWSTSRSRPATSLICRPVDAVRRHRRASTLSGRRSAATARAIPNKSSAPAPPPTCSRSSATACTSAATSSTRTARRKRRRRKAMRYRAPGAAAAAAPEHRDPQLRVLAAPLRRRRIDRRQVDRVRQRPRRHRRRAGAAVRAALSSWHQRRSASRHRGRQSRQLRDRLAQQRVPARHRQAEAGRVTSSRRSRSSIACPPTCARDFRSSRRPTPTSASSRCTKTWSPTCGRSSWR